MKKSKRDAIICCTVALFFLIAFDIVSFALISAFSNGSGESYPFLRFLYLFFFIALPGALFVTIIAILKIKE